MLQVQVWVNGSIGVWVDSQVQNPFFDISDFSEGLEASLIRIKKSNAIFMLSYNLEKISSEKADFYAGIFCEKWALMLNGQSTLKSKKQQSFYTPTGKKYNFMNYEYVISDIDIERAISLFLESKPKNGFLMLINRDNIRTFTNLKFEISRDDAGNLFYRLEYYRRFPYFNYKAGEIYTLDIFSLFNFTGQLIINSQSFLSIIDIRIWLPSNLDFIITESKLPPQLHIRKSSLMAVHPAIEITNGPIMNFKPAESIKELQIEFEVVEKGFQTSSTAIQIIGIIFIIASIVIICTVLYRCKYHGRQHNKKNSSISTQHSIKISRRDCIFTYKNCN